MEDYIFLIIAIVLSIFGAINQNKKKKIQGNPLTEADEKPRNSFMDLLLGADFLNEPEVPKVQSVRIKPVKADVPTKSTIETPREKFYHYGFKSTLPDRPRHEMIKTQWKPKEEDESDEVEESMNYLEDFSLRKAFVYSEIMNRKY